MHLKQKVMPIWLLQYFVAMLMLSSVFLVLLPISGGRKLHCRADSSVEKRTAKAYSPNLRRLSQLFFY